MPNQLANETSPYLRQHQYNPVNWYPWHETALKRAKEENKPIFLSIGYAACHWCHVMAHESFENPLTAQLLNDNFINIKVDREERPDLDDIYMQSVVMLTGQGGWPLSVFLTPDLKPFYGGTYFPPIPRHGLPSFNQVLRSVTEAWHNQQETIENNAQILTDAIREQHTHLEPRSQKVNITKIITRLYEGYDWESGGWGKAPKFPQPMLIEFLIQQALLGNAQAREITSHLLERMARGGMYDLVGGGFHRYSTDAAWLIPHFEKMLYDNAQLALAYLHGFALTGETRFSQVTNETLAFILNEMTHPDGGFYASIDADTPEGEGRYYAWHLDELQKLLSRQEFAHLQDLLGVTPHGNFEDGLNILRFRTSINDTLTNPQNTANQSQLKLDVIFQKLKASRNQRIAPGKDEKIITEWNAMAVQAFAEAGLLLDRVDYLEIAKKGSDFILENLLMPDGRLRRTWRDGQASQPATLADYTAMISALNSIYSIDFDPRIYHHMRSLFAIQQEDFASNGVHYDDASASVANLIVRPRNLQDNATPSGNARAAYIHWLFANYEHEPAHLERTSQMIAQTGDNMDRYPTSFGYWLQIAGLMTQDTKQIALITDKGLRSLQPFLTIYRNSYRPYSIIAAKHADMDPNITPPAILKNRPIVDGRPTAYVCQGFMCKTPVTNANAFYKQLGQI